MWDLGTDHYLHFPVDFKMKADYCAWFVDSDYWKNPNGWDDWNYTDDSVLSSVNVSELLLFSWALSLWVILSVLQSSLQGPIFFKIIHLRCVKISDAGFF